MTKSIRCARSLFPSLIGLFLVFCLGSSGDAQPTTQRSKLEELSRLFREQLDAWRTQLYYDLLKSDSLPQRQFNEDPDIQLMYIDERGHPVFYGVDNLNAAKTISTDDVWPGGTGGYSLSGSETVLGELGVWDAGGVLTTHQEFDGRVTQMDSPGGLHYHSTHVAGTMVATGVDAAAKGMSFQGTLAAYDWSYDESEMASAAASGMNVSSHSYGTVTGWYGTLYWFGDITISQTEDYGFGFYGSAARDWDAIAYSAPYYTIVKSAGNDRNDFGPGPGGGHYVWDPDSMDWVWSTVTREPDGGTDGYDCIPSKGTAKNIITVGAVDDIPGGYTGPGDVVMSSFSGWGPTDDARIKPDLVANGISLYSCLEDSNTHYGSLSGTSMSAPNLSGSLNLLVRYHESTHADTTPLSSTMRALLLHTADEAGPDPGPDYMFGWGLMNTLKAAQLIQQDSTQKGLIIEYFAINEQSVQCSLHSDGLEPIRITMAWTDPPGTPPPASLNPTTPMLVNDLDVRLEHIPSSTIYLPYVLDPGIPDDPASTGDNVRDNVEQIYVTSPSAGNYIVTVQHKGTLASDQYFSLVSSGELNLVPHLPRPHIVSASPTQNELNIATGADISVTFDMDMDPATINNSSFTAIGRYTGIHAGAISYDAPSKTATLDPFNDFDHGEVVTVLMTTAVRSSLNTPLPTSSLWSFTTAVNNGSGFFMPEVRYETNGYSYNGDIFAADLDGDGDLDLAMSSQETDEVSILMNNGDGTFVQGVLYPVVGEAASVYAADLDTDGDVDLAIAGRGADRVSVLLNHGDGTFAHTVNYLVGTGPVSVFAADLDGDGDLDLATANLFSDDVSVLLNHGDGTFGNRLDYPTHGYTTRSVFAADLDGDADLDLATANTSSGDVSVLLNQGDGTFANPVNYPVGYYPYAVFAADPDNDGDLDLATANAGPYTVSVLLNHGDGAFADSVNYPVGTYPVSVLAADLNCDDHLDLATGNLFSDDVSVLLNHGDGTFADSLNYPVGEGHGGIFAADLDGDGDPDLVTASSVTKVSVLLNRPRADCNGDGALGLSDIVYLINYVLKSGPAPDPLQIADGNCDSEINVSDIVYLINYLFRDGPPPGDPDDDGVPNC